MPLKKFSKKTSKTTLTRINAPKQPDPAPSAILQALDRREESEGSENDNTGKLAGSEFEEDSSNDDSDSQAHQEQDSTRSAAGADDEEEESDEDTLIAIPQKRANKTAASKQPKSIFSHLHVPVELATEY